MEYFAGIVIVIGLLSIGWFWEWCDQASKRQAMFRLLERLEEDYRRKHGHYAERIYDLDAQVYELLDGIQPAEIHRYRPGNGTDLILTIVAENNEVLSYRSPRLRPSDSEQIPVGLEQSMFR